MNRTHPEEDGSNALSYLTKEDLVKCKATTETPLIFPKATWSESLAMIWVLRLVIELSLTAMTGPTRSLQHVPKFLRMALKLCTMMATKDWPTIL